MRPTLAARAACLLSALLLAACAGTPTQPSAEARASLAPSGKLRAAINFGNPILAARDPAGGAPRGISVDLSDELARRLGVPVEYVTYDAAGRVVEGLKAGAWDVGYVAIDPVRGEGIAFSPAYVVIEGTYLVRNDSPLQRNEDVDRKGTRVAVGRGSAYDLFLTRELKQAELVRVPTSPQVVDEFVARRLDVAAGVKQQLEADAKRVPGLRMLPGRFMVINQAMATPKGRNEAGARYLREFIEEMKRSGFVARSMERHRIQGAAVAPVE